MTSLRDSWGCLNPSSASPSPGRGCAAWDQFAQLSLHWEGWSGFPSLHASSHLDTGLVWPLRAEAQGPPISRCGLSSTGENHLALVGAGNCLCSWALVLCPAWLPLGQAQSSARLGTGSSWQTQSFSCQLLRVVPGGSCYFCIETHFLLIISVLHLENQI